MLAVEALTAAETETEAAWAAEATVVAKAAMVVVMDTELSHLQTAGCDQYRCRCPNM
jgi:hypothetical protein